MGRCCVVVPGGKVHYGLVRCRQSLHLPQKAGHETGESFQATTSFVSTTAVSTTHCSTQRPFSSARVRWSKIKICQLIVTQKESHHFTEGYRHYPMFHTRPCTSASVENCRISAIQKEPHHLSAISSVDSTDGYLHNLMFSATLPLYTKDSTAQNCVIKNCRVAVSQEPRL